MCEEIKALKEIKCENYRSKISNLFINERWQVFDNFGNYIGKAIRKNGKIYCYTDVSQIVNF